MTDSSDPLHSYLSQARSEGEQDSQGVFSLSKEQVLEKMASFSFPFRGAWLVRLVQSLVATGNRDGIEVQLLKEKAVVRGGLGARWTLDEVEEAFFAPHLNVSVGLHYLRTVLWFLALAGKRELWLHIPGQKDVLYWSGTEFRRFEDENHLASFQLVVSHFSYSETLPTFGASPKAVSENADLLHAASHRLYACPAPLTVDGRRLDTLFHPGFSEGANRRFPVVVGTRVEQGLPSFQLPPGTFAGVKAGELSGFPITEGIDSANSASDQPVALAWVVTANGKKGRDVERWEPGQAGNRLHWIVDGAETAQMVIGSQELSCSVSFLLSAQSLSFDVSGFGIRRDELYQARLHKFCDSLNGVEEICSPGQLGRWQPGSEGLRNLIRAGETTGTFLKNLLAGSALYERLDSTPFERFLNSEEYARILRSAQADVPRMNASLAQLQPEIIGS